MIHMGVLLQNILLMLDGMGAHHPSWISVGDLAHIVTKHWEIIIRRR